MTPQAAQIIDLATDSGITIRLDGDTLKIAGKGKPDPALIDQVRKHRSEIISALKSGPAPVANTAHPANSANSANYQENQGVYFANSLLMPANDLLMAKPVSNKLATVSKSLANATHCNYSELAKLAELAAPPDSRSGKFAVTMDSGALDSPVEIKPADDGDAVLIDGVSYVAAELKRLLAHRPGAAALRTIHEAKRLFGGTVARHGAPLACNGFWQYPEQKKSKRAKTGATHC